MKKEDFQKLKSSSNKFLKDLAERPLLTFLILFFLVLICGGFLFYKYSILTQKAEPEISQKPVQFKENLYQKILEEWQVREERFESAVLKEYINPFQENREKAEPIFVPETEEIILSPVGLQAAKNLLEFYALKGEELPLLDNRAKIWEEKSLGVAKEYIGSRSQNQLLLAELKKELTE